MRTVFAAGCRACGDLLSTGQVFLVLGGLGDWNASEHADMLHCYCVVDGQLHPDIVAADSRLALERFLGRKLRATGKACQSVFRGDSYTWKAHGRKARLDDVYWLSSTPTWYYIDSKWGKAGHDHAVVTAQFCAADPGFLHQEPALRVETVNDSKVAS